MVRLNLFGYFFAVGVHGLKPTNGGESASVADGPVPVQPFCMGGKEIKTAEEYADALLV